MMIQAIGCSHDEATHICVTYSGACDNQLHVLARNTCKHNFILFSEYLLSVRSDRTLYEQMFDQLFLLSLNSSADLRKLTALC